MERRKKGSGQITYVDEPTRKSKWKASVTINNKKKTKYFKTEKEAKAFLRELNSNENKKKALIETGISFSAFVTIFLAEKQKSNMKKGSYETLCSNVQRVENHIGEIMLSDIDSDLVQQLIFDFAKQGYSESILRKSKNVISAMLKMAAAKHFIDSVPVLEIMIPASKKQDADKLSKNNWLKESEIALYEQECKKTYIAGRYTKNAGKTLLAHSAGYKLLFLLHTGLRLGEALALTWADYDERSKTITVDKNILYWKGDKIIQTPKTVSGERVIVLNKQAVEDLHMLRKQFDEQTKEIEKQKLAELEQAKTLYSGSELKAEKKKIKEKYALIENEHKYICGSVTFPYGSSCHNSTKQTHDKICQKIKLGHKVTCHGLRHTYVTHYYLKHKNDSDFDLATFSKTLGHSSVRTTMEIYAHLDLTENRHITRSLAELKDF